MEIVRIVSQGFKHKESWNYLLLITMELPLPFPGRLKLRGRGETDKASCRRV